MNIIELKGLVGAVVLASLGLIISACNTTKATLDTFAQFTSSTSPAEFLDADGLVKESEKARLFTAVVFENLEQDVAQGNGEYLTCLAVLLKIPAGEQDKFRTLSQSAYPSLFASDQRTAESMLATLTSKWENR